jgi:hypothetical protein
MKSISHLAWNPRLMPTESPQDPRPDDLPEDERTGDEPNPSGQAPARKPPTAGRACR